MYLKHTQLFLIIHCLIYLVISGCDPTSSTPESQAGEVTAGEVTAGEVTAGEVTAGEVTAGEVTAGEVTAGEVTAGEVTAGEVTAGEVMTPSVTLRIRALDPLSGSGVTGLQASLVAPSLPNQENLETTTDQSGVASFNTQVNSRYEVILSSDRHPPHHILGDLGEEDAEQITFVSTQQLTSQVFSLLGISPNSEFGTVVVGLDLPNLAPAVGTSAELNTEYEQAFVFGSVTPRTGKTIIEGGGGFVSFANVRPGDVEVTVTPVTGSRCAVFPAEMQGQTTTIQVYPNAVTVIAFTCRNE